MEANSYFKSQTLTVVIAVIAMLYAAVAQSQNLFVSTITGNTIYKYTPDGVKSTYASGLNSPSGIAFDSDGNLFVAEYTSGKIYKFTATGTKSTFASGLYYPNGLACDSAGNLYEADSGTGTAGFSSIYKFTPNGTKSTFATGLFIPAFLAFDSAGNLFESELSTGASYIYKFTPNGTKSTFATLSSRPTGLAFDSAGNLFVADSVTRSIYKYTPDGAQTTFVDHDFNAPVGLAFDIEDNLYVADRDAGNIYEYLNCDSSKKVIFASGLNRPFSISLTPLPPGALQASKIAQIVLPTYGNLPIKQSGKDSLVVITHGLIPALDSATDDMAWVDQMSNSVVQYLAAKGLNNWQVFGYKWPIKAQPKDAESYINPLHAAQVALIAGKQEGAILGNGIASENWVNVHLIAHSAGAGLIQAVSQAIQSSLSSNTVIHCTFLDPFVGVDYSGVAYYGYGSKWSENYFSRDIETGQYTEKVLYYAYNVDVTQLDTKSQFRVGYYISSVNETVESCYKTESSHGWPVSFYSNTISGSVSSDYESFGWPLSQEGGFLSAAQTTYEVGNNPAKALGTPDPECSKNIVYSTYVNDVTLIDFLLYPAVQSVTGQIEEAAKGVIHLFSGSPVWQATVVTPTNAVDLVSFDAAFTSAGGSHGLMSVYWDTNMIGLLDEAAVQPGIQHYSMSFPTVLPNTSHVLGFHLDPFTSIQSSVLLTNVILNIASKSQSLLAVTTNVVTGLRVYQLTGELGNYAVQAATNLISTNWTNIAILANTNGAVNFVDPDSINYSHRFYRAMSE